LATVFPDDDKQHAVAEVQNFLDLVMVVFPGRPIVHEEVTDRGYAIAVRKTQLGHIPLRVGREEAREGFEVPVAVHRLDKGAQKLDRVVDSCRHRLLL